MAAADTHVPGLSRRMRRTEMSVTEDDLPSRMLRYSCSVCVLKDLAGKQVMNYFLFSAILFVLA